MLQVVCLVLFLIFIRYFHLLDDDDLFYKLANFFKTKYKLINNKIKRGSSMKIKIKHKCGHIHYWKAQGNKKLIDSIKNLYPQKDCVKCSLKKMRDKKGE